jgi:hypothetical protein
MSGGLKLGDPIEDAECDTVMLHPADYARFVETETKPK